MRQFQAAYELAQQRSRAQERVFVMRSLRPPRQVGPGVLHRQLEVAEVLGRLRDQAIQEVAEHNATLPQLQPARRSVRSEVLAQFPYKAAALAR